MVHRAENGRAKNGCLIERRLGICDEKRKKAAHFLHVPELACSPQNDALINTYLDLGYEVDLFTPGNLDDIGGYGSRVVCRPVEYGLRWLTRNALLPFWRRYTLFSGTSENPLGTVGVLSSIHRRPAVALVDEIRSGSYSGKERESWKRLCRFGMRKAELNIVNDGSRVGLLKDYAGLSNDAKIVVYPSGYRYPPDPVSRELQRERWGIPKDALVVGASGIFDLSVGADWVIDALKLPGRYGVIQPVRTDPFALFLLKRLAMNSRIYVEEGRLDWRTAWAQAGAMDIGAVIYRNPAPQFQHMGTSSNRLCMFLAMGVPVIASRQDSFQFLEEFDCGILIDDGRSFSSAVDRIRERLGEMRANALRCWKEYVAASVRYIELREAIAGVTAKQ